MRGTWDITDILALLLEFRYTDHPSNIDFYDYEQNVYSIGLLARY